MRARSALFDLWGDHLRSRGGAAPVAAVVRLLAPVGIAAPAVRTAISRMVMQGWLEPVTLAEGRGYRATPRAVRRLDEAAERIYGRTAPAWDGAWRLLLLDGPPTRAQRGRLRADLAYLGYAELGEQVWVSPRPHADAVEVLDRAGARARTARAVDLHPSPVDAWDLASLRAAYDAWLVEAPRLVAPAGAGGQQDGQHDGDRNGEQDGDRAAFAARFHLVHEWRKFLFADPGLPEELLPDDWPRAAATALFDREAARLQPAADRFVEQCLAEPRAEVATA